MYLIDPDGRRERKLTYNASEDLVQDWQPLHDARRLIVRALPSSAPHGGAARLRYRLSDDSGYVRVAGEAHLVAKAFGRKTLMTNGLRPRVVRTSPRRVHVLSVPPRNLLPFSDEPQSAPEPPARFRFCLVAVDPWGNGSSPSCSTFRFR